MGGKERLRQSLEWDLIGGEKGGAARQKVSIGQSQRADIGGYLQGTGGLKYCFSVIHRDALCGTHIDMYHTFTSTYTWGNVPLAVGSFPFFCLLFRAKVGHATIPRPPFPFSLPQNTSVLDLFPPSQHIDAIQKRTSTWVCY